MGEQFDKERGIPCIVISLLIYFPRITQNKSKNIECTVLTEKFYTINANAIILYQIIVVNYIGIEPGIRMSYKK